MVVIYAEKEDMGKKIAAALDAITLDDGTKVTLDDLPKYSKSVSRQAKRDSCFKISFKGEETYVTWGYGHLCGLKQAQDYDPEYKSWNKLPCPFIPKSYELKILGDGNYLISNTKQLKVIKKLFDKADYIINATDDDREGELIFAYVYEFVRTTTPYKRVVFSEQNKIGINKAFNDLIDSADRKNIEMAGRSRNVADALVGWNLTAQLTLHNNSRTVLSVGRVQTAALNILVKREEAIKNFVPQDYFTLEAEFTTKSGEKYKGIHEKKKFDTQKEADDILSLIKGKEAKVSYLNKEKTNVPVPELYNQAALQMDCNDRFGYSAKETLAIAQFLYEKGYTTYPRTSSRYLTENMKDKVDLVLDRLETLPQYAPLIKGRPRSFFKKRFFDNKKVTSHFAIIPTGELPKTLDVKYQNVYDLICRSVIRMIYSDAQVENTKVVTTVEKNNFYSLGKTIVEPNWLVVTGVPKTNTIPALSMGETVIGEYKTEAKKTKPPQRYTDKTFLKAMLSAGKEISDKELRDILSDPQEGGIGTSATRSEIIETLIKREYAERKGKQFFVTDKGMELIKVLPVEDLKSAEITAKWEKRLNEISNGTDTMNSFLSDIIVCVNKWCDEINKSTTMSTSSSTVSSSLKCPVCGNTLKKMKWGWGCSNYKSGCKFSIGASICGKKITDKQVDLLLNKGKTNLIKGFKSKSGKSFDAYLCLDPTKKIVFDFNNKKGP